MAIFQSGLQFATQHVGFLTSSFFTAMENVNQRVDFEQEYYIKALHYTLLTATVVLL